MASKADQYVALRLLNAVTNGTTQAERQQLRADVLGVYGLSEDDASELVTADALEKHSKGDVDDAGQGQPITHDDQDDRTDAQRAADADAEQQRAQAEGRSGTTPAQNQTAQSGKGEGAGDSGSRAGTTGKAAGKS